MRQFFVSSPLPENAVTLGEYSNYNLWIVVASYVLASLGAFLAIAVLRYIPRDTSASRFIGIAVGALVMGVAVWSMHYSGMLAYKMSMIHEYDPWLTAFSGIIAIAFSAAVFSILTKHSFSLFHIFLSAPLLGLGVASMHYVGMEAMKMDASMFYYPDLFFLSIAIAITASGAALWIMNFSRAQQRHMIFIQIIAALIMGVAVCGMHYTGMAATVFVPLADCRFDPEQDHTGLIFSVIGGALFFILIAFFFFARHFIYEHVSREQLFSRYGFSFLIGFIASFGIVLIGLIYHTSQQHYLLAKEKYIESARRNSVFLATHLEEKFHQIYLNLQLISNLPSVQNFDSLKNTLSDSDRMVVQSIYDDLYYLMNLSEIYIVPRTFSLSVLNSKTKEPAVPIAMFDSHILRRSQHGGLAPSSHESELEEYALFSEQLDWMKLYHPTDISLRTHSRPAVTGRQIILCDETQVRPNEPCDIDRLGFVYSVPFFRREGALGGLVSAIFLSSSLQSLLLDADHVLINETHKNAIFPPHPSAALKASESWIYKALPNPDLIYSDVISLSINDGGSKWSLWAGLSDAAFLQSSEVKAILKYRYIGYGASVLLSLMTIISLIFLRRSYWHEKKEITRAKEFAEESNRVKTDFFANMSHELRTPLNGIIGITSLLLQEPLPFKQKDMLEIVKASSDSLLEIVNDILDISKLESGGFTLESIPFCPALSVQKVTALLKPTASARGLLLSALPCEGEDIIILGDPSKFERVLTNLISNALKYTHVGSVTIALRYLNIDISGSSELEVLVNDSGIGISSEKIDRIFEKFSQADSSTTRQYGGTGLGLAITRQLVELMGGTISVKSTENVGSTFAVLLPCILVDWDAEKELRDVCILPDTESDRALLKSLNLLVAEDHLLNQEYLRKLLPSIGISSFTLVENGEQVIQALSARSFDLVLLDCQMPVMSGYDASKIIRSSPDTSLRNIPIIAMTANAMLGEREKCLACGMDEYLSKPFDRSDLKSVLLRTLILKRQGFGLSSSSFSASRVSREKPNDDSAILDLTVLRTFTEGDLESEREFIKLFVQQSVLHLERLSTLCTDGLNQAWKETSHLLKGGCATMGAMQMRSLCAKAQEMLDSSAADRLAILEKIQSSFNETKALLEKEGLL